MDRRMGDGLCFYEIGSLVSLHGFYSCNLVHAYDLQKAGVPLSQDTAEGL
ncbi:MAG: hypothetical protein JW706_02085 [Opitutales bacterium]|nr:hypothetical protein [Opitutales bacterium]